MNDTKTREELTGVSKEIFSPYGAEYVDQIIRCPCPTNGVRWVPKCGETKDAETTDDYRFALAHVIDVKGHGWSQSQTIVPLVIGLCSGQVDALPSVVAERKARETDVIEAKEMLEQDAVDRIEELREMGETPYRCSECEGIFASDELIQVRECPIESCYTVFFNGTDNGRNCEECNRPFTRKVHEQGCPECEPDEEGCVEVA